MTLMKLSSRGIGHLVLPLVFIVSIGITGAYLAVSSHADPATSKSTYLLYSDGGAYDGVKVSSSGFAGAACKSKALPSGKSILFRMPATTSDGKHPNLTLVCTTPAAGSYSVSFVKAGVVPAVPANPQKPIVLDNKTTACLLVHSSNSSNGQGVTKTLQRASNGKCSTATKPPAAPVKPKPTVPKSAPKPKVVKPKPTAVYMLGDSITLGARNYLGQELHKNYKNVRINASSGRSIRHEGSTGDKLSGFQAIDKDKLYIQNANTVIIALGTNYNEAFDDSIKELIAKVRTYNKSATIYWVDIFSHGRVDAATINASITKLADSQHYKIIDTVGKGISLYPDQVHPNPPGSKKFAQIIAQNSKP